MALSQSKRDFVISPLKGNLHSTHTCRQTKTHVVKQSSQSQSSIFTELYSVSEKVTPLFTSLSIFFSSPSSPFLSFHAALFSYPSFFSPSLVFLVCSSAPVSMKIQPLNQTALMVSWERPLTVYHPPITSYMVSYSWVKRDVADEKTFTKTGDQSMVSVAV